MHIDGIDIHTCRCGVFMKSKTNASGLSARSRRTTLCRISDDGTRARISGMKIRTDVVLFCRGSRLLLLFPSKWLKLQSDLVVPGLEEVRQAD